MYHNLYNMVLGNYCCLCDEPGDGFDLCARCAETLPVNSASCDCCAMPVSADRPAGTLLCGRCLREPPPFSSACVPFLYRPPIDHMIKQLKFASQLKFARVAGQLFATHALRNISDTEMPDQLIPVPIHPTRLKVRGFNQADRLAKEISKQLAIPVLLEGVERVQHLPSQAGLSARERERNIAAAFKVSVAIDRSHVAIVDDVLTTGATVRALARKLKASGARKISIWAWARTP